MTLEALLEIKPDHAGGPVKPRPGQVLPAALMSASQEDGTPTGGDGSPTGSSFRANSTSSAGGRGCCKRGLPQPSGLCQEGGEGCMTLLRPPSLTPPVCVWCCCRDHPPRTTRLCVAERHDRAAAESQQPAQRHGPPASRGRRQPCTRPGGQWERGRCCCTVHSGRVC
jgi:hypothetical protein